MDYVINIGSLSVGVVDLIIFIIVMLSAVVNCIRGFVAEFSHVGGLIAGFFTGIMFTSKLSEKLAEVINVTLPRWTTSLIAFVILVLIGYLLIRILGNAIETIVDSFHLGAINNILGFFWGLIASLFFLSVIMYVLTLQNIFDFSNLFNSSIFITRVIEPLLPETISTLESVLSL